MYGNRLSFLEGSRFFLFINVKKGRLLNVDFNLGKG